MQGPAHARTRVTAAASNGPFQSAKSLLTSSYIPFSGSEGYMFQDGAILQCARGSRVPVLMLPEHERTWADRYVGPDADATPPRLCRHAEATCIHVCPW